jgi:hypothetical protein
MRRALFALSAAAVVVTAAGCPATQAFCEQQFKCREELGLELEDDFVDVCVAQTDGEQATLRANAEPECEDLANAQTALAACLQTLDCDKIADEDECKDFRKGVADALDDTDGGAACDAIED